MTAPIVLLVGDDPRAGASLASLLRQHGVRVRIARSASAARLEAALTPVDAVICDGDGALDGLRLLAEIGRRFPSVRIRIVVSLAPRAVRCASRDPEIRVVDKRAGLAALLRALERGDGEDQPALSG